MTTRQPAHSVVEARTALARQMSEDELLGNVIELATQLGWLCDHARPARTNKGWRTPIQGHAGRPDLLLAHLEFGTVQAECKTETGRLTSAEARWAQVLAAQSRPGVRYYLWRPRDWYSGEIEAVLRGEAM
ncbi:MAG: hypothetical protein ABR532_02365 [Candidatus Dormibacteria bacterium]